MEQGFHAGLRYICEVEHSKCPVEPVAHELQVLCHALDACIADVCAVDEAEQVQQRDEWYNVPVKLVPNACLFLDGPGQGFGIAELDLLRAGSGMHLLDVRMLKLSLLHGSTVEGRAGKGFADGSWSGEDSDELCLPAVASHILIWYCRAAAYPMLTPDLGIGPPRTLGSGRCSIAVLGGGVGLV